MKVKFIGNPRDPSDNRGFIDWAGEIFVLNVPRDLPDGAVFAKVPNNSHFEVVEDSAPPPTVNGMTKTDLIEFAEKNGVNIDKRWNIQKISDTIDAAAKALEASDNG